MTKTKPVHEIRLGRIRAAIWPHEVEGKKWHNVTFTRLYKSEEGQWDSSDSFGREDLPLLMKVADLAHTWLYQERTNSAPSTLPEGEAA